MSNSNMKTTLDFEDDKTKELLSKYDLKFFLRQDISENKYSKEQVNTMFKEYESQIVVLEERRSKNRKQFNYYLEGQARKMFRGGLIPSLFHLDNSKGHSFFDFKAVGNDLAYFKLWQEYYKSKVTGERVWSFVIKLGSFLGIVLGIIKLYEILF